MALWAVNKYIRDKETKNITHVLVADSETLESRYYDLNEILKVFKSGGEICNIGYTWAGEKEWEYLSLLDSGVDVSKLEGISISDDIPEVPDKYAKVVESVVVMNRHYMKPYISEDIVLGFTTEYAKIWHRGRVKVVRLKFFRGIFMQDNHLKYVSDEVVRDVWLYARGRTMSRSEFIKSMLLS